MKFQSNSFGKSSIVSKLLIIIGFAFSLAACEWGDQIESLNQPDLDDFAVLSADTVTIQLSTIGTDSLMTGAASRMLLGTYKDPYFGRVKTMSFFQATKDEGANIAQEALYDSLILALKFDNAYSYGDSTKPMNLTVHRLLSNILDKSAYWNHNSTPYDPTPIGKTTIIARPRTTSFLKIKLSDVLGKQVFQKAQNNQLTGEDWLDLVKGLVVVPAATDNGPIVGFKWGGNFEDTTSVQLHYHIPSVSEYKKDSTIFKIKASYNQTVADPTGTQLAKLPENKRISLSSTQTANQAFMQAGTGIMIRVDLPYLNNFKYTKYTAINKAFLKIKPLRASVTNPLRVPPVLYLYRVDKNNQLYTDGNGAPLPVSILGGQGGASAAFFTDLVKNEQYYRFDISSFATELMVSETNDVGGIIIRSSPYGSATGAYRDQYTEFSMSVDRLVVGDQKNSDKGVELELYYTRVKPK
ncbi:protein of unknown function [Dyadobacter sp. SG02]|uniref:DUF4270 family protein n=1 Tax=Dyadobacter sp. SG02 TaxID=1855291 RepID=UPI0008BB0E6C|nr:DUF4270 family protein [Dyadobacter sp. SG02]SEJ72320.1 protein of unknown function [Dyadobacter sp. SG02]